MSRICVKNLPKYVAEDRLREFFSQKGEVTDAKLMRTKDGKSRQFGFVGFRSQHEAEEALQYFNRSFMDTSRITCEIARKVGDPNMPRPWSRHSLKSHDNSSKAEKTIPGPKSSTLEGKNKKTKMIDNVDENDDPQLQEFLQVMNKSKLWANDTLVAPSTGKSKVAGSDKLRIKEGSESESESDEEDANHEGFEEDGNGSSEEQEIGNSKNLVHDDVISDMDYFKSRVRKEWSDSDEEASSDGSDDSDGTDDSDSSGNSLDKSTDAVVDELEFAVPKGKLEDVKSGEQEMIDSIDPSSSIEKDADLDSGRLFIRNLPYTATEDDLEDHFSKFGSISQVHIVIDKDTRRSKGFAYVLFALPESAARALEETDNSIFQGRLLHVMPAKQKYVPDTENNKLKEQSSNGKTFKQQRDAERKTSEASGNTRAWNSLFMRPDTVVENIARKFGVSKTDLLDRESSDMAVRVALGEAQVIAETKKALSRAGVNVSSLEGLASGKTDTIKRSNHVILAKNLPFSSSEREIVDMFGKYGSLDKVILPPVKTLALVIFLQPAEARAAFKGLAYKRYKDAPLYLEWAPDNILSQPIGENNTDMDEPETKRANVDLVEQITDADIEPDRIESRSLYVKNLNFRTTDEAVKKHFSEHMKGGKLLSVRVKKHLKNGKYVSMGFGFVEFDSVDTALKICKDLQGTVLDGHALMLQLCNVKKDEPLTKNTENDRSSTKLIVRNVAFQATEKDLRQLFSPFGQIKRLRLPTKIGSHRGFAFVEYVTKQEARNALQALSNTHLYGRHLVLERAKEGESLEELRARTAAQFTDSSAKLSKKRKHMTVLDEGNVKFERIAN